MKLTFHGAARQVTGRAGVIGAERAFDAPVMRNVERAPIGIVEIGSARACFIAQTESPVEVKTQSFSRGRKRWFSSCANWRR